MAHKRTKKTLPAEGATFAVPLNDRWFGACRVIRNITTNEASVLGADGILLACSAWIGDTLPDPRDPSLRLILHLTHHSWDNRPELLWVFDPPPDDFIPIGKIESTTEEKAISCLTVGHWESVRIQSLAQWRWDNERESVLADDKIKNEKESQQCQWAQQIREKYLANITLEELRNRKFFPRWKKYPPKKAIRASRQIMINAVQQLLDLGTNSLESERMAILQQCIERFNCVNAEMNDFIETVEREDICEEFEGIVRACGLGTHKNLADEWRDW
jgi:hypothetical protein